MKRLTAKASLQRPIKDQILHVSEMFKFCKEKILGITFNLIMKDSMHDVREHLSKRYVAAETLPGTRSFHQFTPISQTTIGVKRVSEDSTYEKEFDFVNAPRPSLNLSELSVSSFTVALYDRKHWVGMVTDIDADHQDYLYAPTLSNCFIYMAIERGHIVGANHRCNPQDCRTFLFHIIWSQVLASC